MHPRYGTLNKIIIEGSTIFDFIYLQFVLTQNCRYGMKTMYTLLKILWCERCNRFRPAQRGHLILGMNPWVDLIKASLTQGCTNQTYSQISILYTTGAFCSVGHYKSC